jgi:F-type H+-transporting ATPase subunit delta
MFCSRVLRATSRTASRALFRPTALVAPVMVRSFAKAAKPAAAKGAAGKGAAGKQPEKPKVARKGTLMKYGETGQLAHNLLNAGLQNGSDLKKVAAGLTKFQQMLDDTPEIGTVVYSGPVPLSEKVEYLEQKFFPGVKGTANDVDPLAQAMIVHMIEEGTFDADYVEVCQAFDELVLDEVGEVRGVVTSADALEKGQLSKIEAKLKTLLEPGQKLTLTTVVDPKILGGLHVRVGTQVQDLSVSNAIAQLELTLNHSLTGAGQA